MSWPLWLSLVAAIAGATAWANAFYWFWSVRFMRWKILGVIAEWAFLVMVTGLGFSGFFFLLEHHP